MNANHFVAAAVCVAVLANEHRIRYDPFLAGLYFQLYVPLGPMLAEPVFTARQVVPCLSYDRPAGAAEASPLVQRLATLFTERHRPSSCDA